MVKAPTPRYGVSVGLWKGERRNQKKKAEYESKRKVKEDAFMGTQQREDLYPQVVNTAYEKWVEEEGVSWCVRKVTKYRGGYYE